MTELIFLYADFSSFFCYFCLLNLQIQAINYVSYFYMVFFIAILCQPTPNTKVFRNYFMVYEFDIYNCVFVHTKNSCIIQLCICEAVVVEFCKNNNF